MRRRLSVAATSEAPIATAARRRDLRATIAEAWRSRCVVVCGESVCGRASEKE